MNRLSRRALLIGFAGLPIVGAFATQAAPSSSPSRLAFRIAHGGQDIGRHSVVVTRHDDVTKAEIATDLEVRVAFLVVYRYRHRASETWRDGRLIDLSAWTNEDGQETRVRAVSTAAGLAVDGPAGRLTAADDVTPNSYWNIAALRPGSGQWLDSESGRIVAVEVAPLAAARPGGAVQDALAFRIDGEPEHAPLEAFYAAADRRWIGLRFSSRGATVDYRPET